MRSVAAESRTRSISVAGTYFDACGECSEGLCRCSRWHEAVLQLKFAQSKESPELQNLRADVRTSPELHRAIERPVCSHQQK
jgi:hypothetical protein